MSIALQISRATVIAIALALALMGGSVYGNHATPGTAGQTKVNIYDNTNDGWNVTVGDPDPVIGFVNFLPTTPDAPNTVKLVVALKDGAPSCDYNVELVTSANNPSAGLAPDGFHTGFINTVGTLTTNEQGKGNTGTIEVDVTTLAGVAASGDFTYAHVDLEDHDNNCTESDGTGVASNEYGASGKQPGSTLDLPVNIHWTQP